MSLADCSQAQAPQNDTEPPEDLHQLSKETDRNTPGVRMIAFAGSNGVVGIHRYYIIMMLLLVYDCFVYMYFYSTLYLYYLYLFILF